jgi:glycosyltransferase involved in cell wall biosynthesis
LSAIKFSKQPPQNAAKHLNTSTFILLASFNGDKFLPEQLDSLLAQTEPGWTLLVRDDGSTDGTLEIIRGYAQKDHRVQLHVSESGDNGSALVNFSALLNAAYKQGAEYVFCCDQDDVWNPGKVEIMLTRLKQLEGQGKVPSLVHHDLEVVGGSLEPIAGSFIKLMRLHPSGQQHPQRLLSRNEVTGCAMACNRELLEIALPISGQAVMHDWWLALSAAYFGRLAFIPDKLVKYRQHGENAIGAKSFWQNLNPLNYRIMDWERGNEDFVDSVIQAGAFKESMADRLEKESEAYSVLESYSRLLTATRWQRLNVLRRHSLWRSYWFLNLILVLRMMLLPRASGA